MRAFSQLLKHFGFELNTETSQENVLNQLEGHQGFALIADKNVKWYVPKEKHDIYLRDYQAEPFLLVTPQKEEKSALEHHDCYVFNYRLVGYEHVIQLIQFIQSGLVDGFWFEERSYFFHPVIMKFNAARFDGQEVPIETQIEACLTALKEASDDVILRNYIGKLHIESGKLSDAARYFVDVCEAQPFFAEPFSNMGAIVWNSGEKEKGFHLFCEALIRNPFDETLQDNFIKSGLDLGQVDVMEKYLEKIDEYFPEYSGLLFLKSMLLEKLGCHDKSIVTLKSYLEKFPEDEHAKGILQEWELNETQS